ncbi:DegT/DnrJ/EryC1/StrS family aminotransferase [Desulfonatronovibrio hydrogenovorans]|uniref:DegT/DnrJ/EryC1/StrS family aminotransferase n=1 Tax=Desulfonatronovibrio hydrogenovorans TaxID=53245 RepID=UPI00048AE9CF|nr:DegT/DnrJ/EryC1/StrS family aminotransferase [Desulfonatronovibrio hydrogenovorans]
MNVPFIDLKTQFSLIKDQVQTNMDRVLDHGAYVMGPEIRELEKRLADFCGQKHALACSSGTDALVLALLALDLKPGDGVLTTPFTFFATAEAIAFIGAVPIFVDIDPRTFNIDPAKLTQTLAALKKREKNGPALPRSGGKSQLGHPVPKDPVPRAVISVDLFGLPCDYDQLEEIVRSENLKLIVDAAQSFGAEYKGRSTCAIGDLACTSFFPAKPLGCYGDGGMCFTSHTATHQLMESLRVHGQGRDRYENVRLGLNARMDTLQAAVLLAKMEVFPRELELRCKAAENYNRLFEGSDLAVPRIFPDRKSAWAQYSLLARDRDHRQAIFKELEKNNIPWAIYYPLPLHRQKAFTYLGYETGDFPVSEDFSERIFSLPMHPYLESHVQEKIVRTVLSA